MYCNRCGAYIPEDAEFCPQCGSRVSRRAAQAQMQEGIPIRRAHRSNSVVIGAILAVAAVLIVCIICLTVVTKGNQQAQLEASRQSQTQQTEQPKHSTASTNSDAEDAAEQEKTSDSQVTNNYYYYGSNAEHANDYYNQVGSSGYLWPSDSEYISASDLSGLNQDAVAAIRNEIYARHGYAFNSTRWQNYFSSKTWYHRDSTCTANNIDSRLSDIERANIATLVSYEENKGWR